MTDPDLFGELRRFTDAGDQARPLPADRVRALGTRRRTRRHVAVGGTLLAAVLVVGAGVLGQGGPQTLQDPPVASPVAGSPVSPTPVRAVTAAELPAADAIPLPQGAAAVREWTENVRPDDEVSACLTDGLAPLGATSSASRAFKVVYDFGPGESPDPDAPGVDEPTYYAVALQFPDAAAAGAAAATYREWIADCQAGDGPADLDVLTGNGRDWTEVSVDGGTAEVAEVVYRLSSDGEGGTFESSGLTQVGDRLMLTVDVLRGAQDKNTTLEADNPDGMTLDPQLGLTAAAAAALAR